jgi:hypothetical protein
MDTIFAKVAGLDVHHKFVTVTNTLPPGNRETLR